LSFGNEATLSDDDLNDVTMGLELSGLPYLFVLKKQDSFHSRHDWLESRSNKHGL